MENVIVLEPEIANTMADLIVDDSVIQVKLMGLITWTASHKNKLSNICTSLRQRSAWGSTHYIWSFVTVSMKKLWSNH